MSQEVTGFRFHVQLPEGVTYNGKSELGARDKISMEASFGELFNGIWFRPESVERLAQKFADMGGHVKVYCRYEDGSEYTVCGSRKGGVQKFWD